MAQAAESGGTASEAGPERTPEEAQAAYAAGLDARDRGAHEEAANQFFTAYRSLPPEPRERRAAVLFELIAARRSAYEAQGDAAQLCASQRVLDAYIEEQAAETDVHRDTRKARELRAVVTADVELLRETDPALDCVTLRVEGGPPATAPER
ncbi:MAG: hypothetical protein KC468_00865, partial [Myxococcales bacterium]|nr:hypothetical protein [Myxococcales bacterium]